MNRLISLALSVVLAISSVTLAPATPASASHISCSLIHFPIGWPGMGSEPYSYGSSGYAQMSCNGTTDMYVAVQLAINGGFSSPAAQRDRMCAGVQDCPTETVIVCCHLATDYHHTRATGFYDDKHGQTVVIPWTSWKCWQIDPGSGLQSLKPGALVALASIGEAGGEPGPVTMCSGSLPRRGVST